MSLINPDHWKQPVKPLKRSTTGMEIEFHLIDTEGKISYRAPEIVRQLNKKGYGHITTEIGKNMIEFGCLPSVETYNPALQIISSIRHSMEHCQQQGLLLYPLATYPGKFSARFTAGGQYQILRKIFGREKTGNITRIVGFHHHYAFPKGVFDEEKKEIRLFRKSKLARSMVSCYNFEVAADPALAVFTQSSPFFQGAYLGKDSRMLVYRGGKKLRFMGGFYAHHQQLGGLPPYKQTLTDLLASLHQREQRWHQEVRCSDPDQKCKDPYPYPLDITRNPVKLNKHGTFEQRGMDANYLSVLVAVTILLKFSLREIQRKFYEVLPADFGIREAFKVENGILYVPPHTIVRNSLQAASAYEGYENKDLCHYAKRFFRFAQSATPKRYYPLIRPVKEMLDDRKSVSDWILAYAKRKGFVHNNRISNRNAAEIALYYAGRLREDLEETQRMLEKLSGV